MHIEEATETFAVLDLDPGLRPYKDHFGYRMKRYISQKKLIEKYEGSLEDFAQGNDCKSAYTRKLCFLSNLRSCLNFSSTHRYFLDFWFLFTFGHKC